MSAEVSVTQSSAGAKGGADPLDDLFPRVEIDRLLVGTTILADSKSDAWKTRKDALEMLQGILDVGSNKRLKPAMGASRLTGNTNSPVTLQAISDKYSRAG